MPHHRKRFIEFSLKSVVVSQVVECSREIGIDAHSLFGQLCRSFPLVIVSAHGERSKPIEMLVSRIAPKKLIHGAEGSDGVATAVSNDPLGHELFTGSNGTHQIEYLLAFCRLLARIGNAL